MKSCDPISADNKSLIGAAKTLIERGPKLKPTSCYTAFGANDVSLLGALQEKGVPAMRFQQSGIDFFGLHHTPDDRFDKVLPKNIPEDISEDVAACARISWIAANADEIFR